MIPLESSVCAEAQQGRVFLTSISRCGTSLQMPREPVTVLALPVRSTKGANPGSALRAAGASCFGIPPQLFQVRPGETGESANQQPLPGNALLKDVLRGCFSSRDVAFVKQ